MYFCHMNACVWLFWMSCFNMVWYMYNCELLKCNWTLRKWLHVPLHDSQYWCILVTLTEASSPQFLPLPFWQAFWYNYAMVRFQTICFKLHPIPQFMKNLVIHEKLLNLNKIHCNVMLYTKKIWQLHIVSRWFAFQKSLGNPESLPHVQLLISYNN